MRAGGLYHFSQTPHPISSNPVVLTFMMRLVKNSKKKSVSAYLCTISVSWLHVPLVIAYRTVVSNSIHDCASGIGIEVLSYLFLTSPNTDASEVNSFC